MEQTHSHPFHFRNETHTLTKTETKIARYILENLQRIPTWSIEQLSRELKTSTATISRFARALGYESYKDLKNDIAIHTTYTPEDKIRQSISKNSDIHKDLFQREAVNIGITATLLDYKTLNNASSSILNGEKIYIYAKGASISLVHLLAFRLRRFGLTVIPLISGGSEIFEYLVHVTENDVFIVIGFGNVPLELDIILGECLERKCRSIYITDSKPKYIDKEILTLRCERGKEDEYHSLAAPMIILDALILEVARERKKISPKNPLADLYNLKEKYRLKLPRHK